MIAVAVAALLAQADPTPFWMPPPPPEKKKKEEAPPKKKKKPPPVQVAPLEIPARPAPKPAPEQPTWIEPGDSHRGQSPGTVSGDTLPKAPPPTAPDSPHPTADAVPRLSPETVPKVVKPIVPPPEPAPQPQVPAPIVVESPEPEPVAADVRRVTVDAIVGAWGASGSDGSGTHWDLAYGLRGGYAILENLELELQYARSSENAGSPFVSATAARNLIAARLFYVLGDRFALLLGGGGGVVLTQTHYSLLTSTDPGAVASGLDATAVKGVIEITAAGRARIYRGLEARAEVSTLLRDGRVELLPLLAVGAAF